MQIKIQARRFSLTATLRKYTQQRLRYALTSSTNHIQRVIVRLSDINGPRGGIDKRCHIQVVLKGLPDVVIEDTGSDLYNSISRAADRASRTVSRSLRRRIALRRSKMLQNIEALPIS
ncbi:MAG: HPF/RaiA family ribosome-associated protein [Candidatus Polarisedimenticolaceae bacterium]|nr:HPF/RaiA family ribosome-associated protein [Candidatus Polarisedimenticolaceae bacterium]